MMRGTLECFSQIPCSRLPPAAPTAVGGMSRTELDTELQKGVASLQNGKSFSVDEVDAALYQEFGI